MKLGQEGKILRIYIGYTDKLGHTPLHEVLVQKARKMGMAGATVVTGVAGYGAGHDLRVQKILSLTENVPVQVQIVDTAEKVDAFAETASSLLEQAGCGGVISEGQAHLIHYKPRK